MQRGPVKWSYKCRCLTAACRQREGRQEGCRCFASQRELEREGCSCRTAAHRRGRKSEDRGRERVRRQRQSEREREGCRSVTAAHRDASRRVRRQDDRARPPRRDRLRVAGLVDTLHLTPYSLNITTYTLNIPHILNCVTIHLTPQT